MSGAVTELFVKNTGRKGLLPYAEVRKGVLRETQGSLEEGPHWDMRGRTITKPQAMWPSWG